MSEGFEVYDANGKLQFDQNIFTHALVEVGNGAVDYLYGTTSGTINAIMVGASYLGASVNNDEIIAVRCDGYKVVLLDRPGATLGEPTVFVTDAPIGTAFTYYKFRTSSILTPGQYGLELYNASGQLTFSTNYFPMKALGVLTYTYPAGGSESGTLTGTWAGKTLALAQGTSGRKVTADGSPVDVGNGAGGHQWNQAYHETFHGATISGSTATVSHIAFAGTGSLGNGTSPSAFVEMNNPLTMMVVDVTNIDSSTHTMPVPAPPSSYTTDASQSVNSATYPGVTLGIFRIRAASTTITLAATLTYKRNGTVGGSSTAYGKWQWRPIGGTFSDVGPEIAASDATVTTPDPEGIGPPTKTAGHLAVSMTQSATIGQDYEFILLRRAVADDSFVRMVTFTGNASVSS